MYDLLVQNGKLVSPDGVFRNNVAVKDGKIVAIGDWNFRPEANEVVDATENYLLPGVIDTHFHIGWMDTPFNRDCANATKAAIAGGVTTVLTYLGIPNMDHLPYGTEEEVKHRTREFNENSYCDGSFFTTFYGQEGLKNIVPLACKSGVPNAKFFLNVDEMGKEWGGIDNGTLYQAFLEFSRLEKPAMPLLHCEDYDIYKRISEEVKEKNPQPKWNEARPSIVEIIATERAVSMAKATNCPVYIVHMSIKEAADIIKKAKEEGVTVFGETCPHYLTMNVDNTEDVLVKVNPPVRTKEDNEALWKAIRDGYISTVGSDYVTVSKKSKGNDIWTSLCGMSFVELMLPILLNEGVNKGRISLEKVVEVTAYNPAKIFGLYPKKGTIAIGSDADFVIVDMNKEKTVKIDDLKTVCDFNPFEGQVFKGWPIKTFLRGKLMVDGEEVSGKKGNGKIIPRYTELKK